MNNNIDKKMIKKGMLPYLLLILVMLGVVYLASVYNNTCLLYTDQSPRDLSTSRMPSYA